MKLKNTPEGQFKNWYNVSDIYACPAALLDYFITDTSSTHCADPRDQIFGILGMVKETSKYGGGPGLEFVANYHESTVDVYIKVMSLILSSTGTLTPLSRAMHRQQCNFLELPSRVNDFSQFRTLQFLNIQQNQSLTHATPFDASRQSTAGLVVHGRALYLHHFAIAKVAHIGEYWEEMRRERSFERTARPVLAW